MRIFNVWRFDIDILYLKSNLDVNRWLCSTISQMPIFTDCQFNHCDWFTPRTLQTIIP